MENGENMKSILYSVCIGSLALALAAGGAQAATDKNKRQERATPQQRTTNVQAARPANTGRSTSMSAHRNVSAAQYRQRSYPVPRTSSAVNRTARPASATRTTAREYNVARNTPAVRPTSRSTGTARNQNSSVN